MTNISKTILTGCFVAGALSLLSCSGSVDSAAETTPAASAAKSANGYKIAFVQIDTLTSQYQKCKDLEEEFAKKRANAEATITAKGKTSPPRLRSSSASFRAISSHSSSMRQSRFACPSSSRTSKHFRCVCPTLFRKNIRRSSKTLQTPSSPSPSHTPSRKATTSSSASHQA